MIPALGRALILLALSGGERRSPRRASPRAPAAAPSAGPSPGGSVYAFAALMAAANLLMVYALVTRDFSVSYVAQVGSRSVPNWVAVVSLWSSLEGSILFWGLVMGAYVAAGHLATARPPSRVHALCGRGVDVLRGLLRLPDGRPGPALPHRLPGSRRRPGAERRSSRTTS